MGGFSYVAAQMQVERTLALMLCHSVPAAYLTLAVDKWNTLTDAERKEYIENHKHEFDDIPAQEDASLLAPAEEAEPSPPEEPAANGAESVEEDLAVSICHTIESCFLTTCMESSC